MSCKLLINWYNLLSEFRTCRATLSVEFLTNTNINKIWMLQVLLIENWKHNWNEFCKKAITPILVIFNNRYPAWFLVFIYQRRDSPFHGQTKRNDGIWWRCQITKRISYILWFGIFQAHAQNAQNKKPLYSFFSFPRNGPCGSYTCWRNLKILFVF